MTETVSPEQTTEKDSQREPDETLDKELGLFDVYAVCTGAMFSSGFFLLPGIAAAETGPSVVLAYLLSGLLVLPAALCTAELSTAMPRAGGAYFFLDRTLGPLMGTVGGIGTWVAMVLKSSFALVGMGAYLTLFADLPIRPVALALIVVFTFINFIGAKQSGGLQRVLVAVILGILAYFLIAGLWDVANLPKERISGQLSPFLTHGLTGLFGTVGLVFVSYAGLTKVASVAEEVQNPDRNVPLGMLLALGSTMLLYVLGIFVMVMVLDPSEFHRDLTPVATAGEAVLRWLPEPTGLYLVVGAAIAAFASTGNAGLMSASRYPLAMARDELVPSQFGKISRFKTPTLGVLTTGGIMAVAVLVLDVASLAKLASAIQLILFGLMCMAVIIMRESELKYYHAAFSTPLYPWTPILGILIPIWLIIEMGWMPVLFTAGVTVVALIWYYTYAIKRVERGGALYHLFERLGRRADTGLHHELRQVMAEKGLARKDVFEEVIAHAIILDLDRADSFGELLASASEAIAKQEKCSSDQLLEVFCDEIEIGLMPVSQGAAIPHARISGIEGSHLALVRVRGGVDLPENIPRDGDTKGLYAVFCLVSPEEDTGQHLQVLAELAGHIDQPNFQREWLDARDEADLKTLLLRSERLCHMTIEREGPTSSMVGQRLCDVDLPEGVLVALMRRAGIARVPTGGTRFRPGDELIIIGNPDAIETLRERCHS